MIMAREVEAPKLHSIHNIRKDSHCIRIVFASYSHFAKICKDFAVCANWSKTYSLGFAHIRIQSHWITSGHTCEFAKSHSSIVLPTPSAPLHRPHGATCTSRRAPAQRPDRAVDSADAPSALRARRVTRASHARTSSDTASIHFFVDALTTTLEVTVAVAPSHKNARNDARSYSRSGTKSQSQWHQVTLLGRATPGRQSTQNVRRQACSAPLDGPHHIHPKNPEMICILLSHAQDAKNSSDANGASAVRALAASTDRRRRPPGGHPHA